MVGWTLETVFGPVGPVNGSSAKVSVSGQTIAVAWPSALDVYTFASGQWSAQRVSTGSGFQAVALENDTLVLGLAGQVQAFSRTNGVWSSPQMLASVAPVSAAGFGAALALRGDVLIVGDPALTDNVGQVIVFDRVGGVWTASPLPIASVPDAQECFTTPADEHFGQAVALTSFAAAGHQIDRLVVGKPGIGQTCTQFHSYHPGQVYVFERADQGAWALRATLGAQQPTPAGGFGTAVAVDRDAIFVGASIGGAGEIEGFVNVNGTWIPNFEQTGPGLGPSLAFDGDTVAFGAAGALDYADSSNFTGEWGIALAPNTEVSALSVDGALMAAVDDQAHTVSVFRPGLKRQYASWATINPLVLVIGEQAFIRLTLPDPPPDGWARQIAVGIEAMTPRERRTAARSLRANIALLSDVRQQLLKQTTSESTR